MWVPNQSAELQTLIGATWPIHLAALAFEPDAYSPPSRASLAAFLRISPHW